MTSAAYRLPMFPLGTPLLPGRLLPLRIFEPRYLALLRECLSHETPEFGVVLIERGAEVGGGEQRTSVGTVAEMLEVAPRPSGDVSVLALGRRRLRVSEWLPDDPHPWAMVENWNDDVDGPSSAHRSMMEELLARISTILVLARSPHEEFLQQMRESLEVLDAAEMSYALAGAVGFGAADQHRLLSCPGVAERLVCMMELLDDVEAVVRFRQDPL